MRDRQGAGSDRPETRRPSARDLRRDCFLQRPLSKSRPFFLSLLLRGVPADPQELRLFLHACSHGLFRTASREAVFPNNYIHRATNNMFGDKCVCVCVFARSFCLLLLLTGVPTDPRQVAFQSAAQVPHCLFGQKVKSAFTPKRCRDFADGAEEFTHHRNSRIIGPWVDMLHRSCW